ncbi:hypothetical protein F7P00_02425 [Pseudomonas aeruginosa]|nr:hypothetical protein F7P00_02425 [Pseudomonas aeruginosa]MCO3037455.1 hypothetical protein [Pseudomonas aeruginosa]MCO3784156.1 hypothetical protein [Pseudomonas aeruginosa]HBP5651160.1 hypothetical protein [Pseudomonas aeruginosa]
MAACRREQRCSEGTPAEKRLGPDAGASLLVPFGRLQKELAWKGETRGQGKHDARSSAKQQLPPLVPCR